MPSTQQGFYSKLRFSAGQFRVMMNLWPPFWGLRVHITEISPDWRALSVRMKLSLRNKNYVGSHFGGGLFAMTDPFYMLLLMNVLGKEFVVWDKSAKISFLKPGRGTVFAHFKVTDEMLAEITARTQDGAKFEPTYLIEIVDGHGERIAEVEKTLYIRRKAPK